MNYLKVSHYLSSRRGANEIIEINIRRKPRSRSAAAPWYEIYRSITRESEALIRFCVRRIMQFTLGIKLSQTKKKLVLTRIKLVVMWKSASNSHSVRVYSFETSVMWKSLWSANSHKCCGVARWNFENYQKDVNSMWCVCFWISQFIFTFYGLSSTHRTYSIAFNLHKLTFLFDVRCYHRLLCPLLSGICRWCTKIVTIFCRKFTTGTTARMEHKVYYWPKNSSSAERWAYGKKKFVISSS